MPITALDVQDLRLLAASWTLALRAERKSPQTLKNYGDGVRFYLDWCAAHDRVPLQRDSLRGWVAELLEAGMARIGVSIGAAHAAPGERDLDSLLGQADQLMYEVKRSRKAGRPAQSPAGVGGPA